MFSLKNKKNEKKEDNPVTITIIGGPSAGKRLKLKKQLSQYSLFSSLTLKYLKDVFYEDYDPTIEERFTTKIEIEGHEPIQVEILDTAGQDHYQVLLDSWIRQSDCFIFCYDISDRSALVEMEKIIKKAKQGKEHEMTVPSIPFVPSVLVACKSDLKRRIEVSDALEFGELNLFFDDEPAEEYPYFVETSAKSKKKKKF
eukprot:gene4976-8570_t